MPITSSGLGSGLDIKGIVAKLMQTEQQPLVQLNKAETKVQAQISSYGSLKGSLSTLQDAMAKLKDVATFQATKSTSSDPAVFTVSSDKTALNATYNVTVNQLAQSHKLGSSAIDSTATFGGTAGDKLILKVGTNSFNVDLSGAKTLTEIQAAINVDTNTTGVTAGLISGNAGKQTLVLTSGTTGYDGRVQLSYAGAVNVGSFNFTMLNQDANGVPLTSTNQLDASLNVDGVAVTRSSNSITDAVSGLTLNLKAAGQATATIAQDTSVAQTAVNSFISAYNGLKGQLTQLKASGVSGSFLRGLNSQLRGMLNTARSGLGHYSYLAELGITSDAKTGMLALDSTKFTTALKDNSASVLGFFSDANKGFAVKFDSLINIFVQPGGTIDSFTSSAKNQISDFERNRDSINKRLATIEKNYQKKFAAMDSLVATMTKTGQYLTQQLAALSSSSSTGK